MIAAIYLLPLTTMRCQKINLNIVSQSPLSVLYIRALLRQGFCGLCVCRVFIFDIKLLRVDGHCVKYLFPNSFCVKLVLGTSIFIKLHNF